MSTRTHYEIEYKFKRKSKDDDKWTWYQTYPTYEECIEACVSLRKIEYQCRIVRVETTRTVVEVQP